MPYVKLDCGILDSSLWVEPSDTRIVWITMLAMADATGLVEATAPGIARKACVPIESCRNALQTFESIDGDSRTRDSDGRRIERVNGGYQILNYQKYRNKDYTAAARQRRRREKLGHAVTCVTDVVHGHKRHAVTSLPVTEAEAEAEAKAKAKEETALSKPKNGFDVEGFASEVFDYYRVKFNRDEVLYTLTPKRKAMFLARMKEVWKSLAEPKRDNAVSMSKYAIDQLAKSPYHNGQNDQKKKYIEWEIIFRSQEQFQKWVNQ